MPFGKQTLIVLQQDHLNCKFTNSSKNSNGFVRYVFLLQKKLSWHLLLTSYVLPMTTDFFLNIFQFAQYKLRFTALWMPGLILEAFEKKKKSLFSHSFFCGRTAIGYTSVSNNFISESPLKCKVNAIWSSQSLFYRCLQFVLKQLLTL